MKITIHVTQSDDSKVTTTTGYADSIALEEKYGIATSDFAAKPVLTADGRQAVDTNGEPLEQITIHATWLAFLAWNSLRRRKETTLTFEQWHEQIEELELDQTGSSGN